MSCKDRVAAAGKAGASHRNVGFTPDLDLATTAPGAHGSENGDAAAVFTVNGDGPLQASRAYSYRVAVTLTDMDGDTDDSGGSQEVMSRRRRRGCTRWAAGKLVLAAAALALSAAAVYCFLRQSRGEQGAERSNSRKWLVIGCVLLTLGGVVALFSICLKQAVALCCGTNRRK